MGEGMRKLGLGLLLFFACISNVHAESYCVMNGDDGTVVEQSDMHKTQSVASISKIMTAIIAIENGHLEDQWQVSDAILAVDGSSIYLKVGDKADLRSLLYGLLLRSGNDAAVEIAVHVGGSEANFVEMMNEKAKELGMNDTIFHNPSGLDEEDGGNISSAYDMALLMRYALTNKTFKEIAGSPYFDYADHIRWTNKNKLLFTYEPITAGKTGYTKKAGRTLVTSAEANDLESIVVTLDMGDDFHFHEQKHEAMFANYTSYEVLKAGTYHAQGYRFTIPDTVRIALSNNASHDLQIQSDIRQGVLHVEVYKDGERFVYEWKGVKDSRQKKGWLF